MALLVTVPEDINLKWDTVYELSITDDVGELTLASVTLSAQAGWETQVFDGTIPAGIEESLYAEAITDLGYTAIAGDIFAWETQTGLTYDAGMFPTIDPAATTTHDYKVWDDTLNTWSATSTATWTDGGDTTAPIITLNGDEPLAWLQGDVWVDPGATVTDGTGPTKQIDADTIPDVNIVNTYTIAYNTTDVAGNVAVTVTRDVIVSAAALLDFNITTIRTTAGVPLSYTYPLGEIWSAVPEEGGTLLDSSASVVITNGTGLVQSSILLPSTEYLPILSAAFP